MREIDASDFSAVATISATRSAGKLNSEWSGYANNVIGGISRQSSQSLLAMQAKQTKSSISYCTSTVSAVQSRFTLAKHSAKMLLQAACALSNVLIRMAFNPTSAPEPMPLKRSQSPFLNHLRTVDRPPVQILRLSDRLSLSSSTRLLAHSSSYASICPPVRPAVPRLRASSPACPTALRSQYRATVRQSICLAARPSDFASAPDCPPSCPPDCMAVRPTSVCPVNKNHVSIAQHMFEGHKTNFRNVPRPEKREAAMGGGGRRSECRRALFTFALARFTFALAQFTLAVALFTFALAACTFAMGPFTMALPLLTFALAPFTFALVLSTLASALFTFAVDQITFALTRLLLPWPCLPLPFLCSLLLRFCFSSVYCCIGPVYFCPGPVYFRRGHVNHCFASAHF